jgi:hypothetical protein
VKYYFAKDIPEDERLPFLTVWGIYVGLAQVKMKWYYNWSEIKFKEDDNES